MSMLTPIDIQNREIKSKMGGYDKKDVDDFLEEIRGSYEGLYKENESLKEKIRFCFQRTANVLMN